MNTTLFDVFLGRCCTEEADKVHDIVQWDTGQHHTKSNHGISQPIILVLLGFFILFPSHLLYCIESIKQLGNVYSCGTSICSSGNSCQAFVVLSLLIIRLAGRPESIWTCWMSKSVEWEYIECRNGGRWDNLLVVLSHLVLFLRRSGN